MSYRQVMDELKAAGTAQNRKIYARHGVEGEMFGVSYANLGKMAKRLKTDQPLAERLWASGNHDARLLAAMIADPDAIRSSTLDAWARDLGNYPLTDAFAGLVAKTPFAESKLRRWTRARNEFVGQAGWTLVAILAMKADGLDDSYFERLLPEIEKKIGGAENRTRYAMNNALMAIGIRSSRLEKKAIAAARRIGPVEVDHGETSCKTPDAEPYILRARARKKARR